MYTQKTKAAAALNKEPVQARLDSSKSKNADTVIQAFMPNRNASIVQKSGDGTSFGMDLRSPSGGKTLEPAVQAKMEQSIGGDFGNVRLHEDGQADAVGAHAFAAGNNIHFAQGKLDQSSQQGQSLLGHELTHVVQQREGRVNPPSTSGGNATVFQDPGLEAEADAKGAQAAQAKLSPEASARVAKSSGNGSDAVQAKMAVQQKPTVQMVLPAVGAALSALWGTLSSAAAAQAATVAGTLLAAGAMATSSKPSKSGAKSHTLQEGGGSEYDKINVEQIILFDTVNRYVNEEWGHLAKEAGKAKDAGDDAKKTTPSKDSKDGGKAGPKLPDSINSAKIKSLSLVIKKDIESSFKTNVKTQSVNPKSFIWSDSGDHTADTFGTVGQVQFRDHKSTYISRYLSMSKVAKKLGLKLNGANKQVKAVKYLGGIFEEGPKFETGMNDDLKVWVSAVTKRNYSGKHITYEVATDWEWDNNITNGYFTISNNAYIGPNVTAKWRGTPDD